MGVGVNAAGHDVAAGGIECFIAAQIGPDLDNDIALDLDVGLVGQVRGHDGAVLDDFVHGCVP